VEEWVFNIAADVAIRPYKLLQKAHLAFCPADGVRKGTTPVSTFELMLQEVPGITPSAAAGIAAEYSSLHDLMLAFERAERKAGAGKGEELLQDCQVGHHVAWLNKKVRNLRDGTASGRRLNKALAKKVYRTFRGEDSLAL
jgi:crossover junction endonuclease EME1